MNKKLISLSVVILLFSSAGLALAQGVELFNPLGDVDDFPTLIAKIATYIRDLIAGIAVLVFIWAGILYLTSGANPSNIQKANKAVLYAVIGLGIAIAGTGLILLIQTIITG